MTISNRTRLLWRIFPKQDAPLNGPLGVVKSCRRLSEIVLPSISNVHFGGVRGNVTLSSVLSSRDPLPYNSLPKAQREHFVKEIVSSGGVVDVSKVKSWCDGDSGVDGNGNGSSSSSSSRRKALLDIVRPNYEPHLRELLSGTVPNGLPFLIQLRSDVLYFKRLWSRTNSEPQGMIEGCKDLDDCIKELLKLYFSVGLLELRR